MTVYFVARFSRPFSASASSKTALDEPNHAARSALGALYGDGVDALPGNDDKARSKITMQLDHVRVKHHPLRGGALTFAMRATPNP